MKHPSIIITASSLACLFSCARKYYLSYVCGWRKKKSDNALRFGTAFHKGIEVWFNGASPVDALSSALATAGEEEFDAETAAVLTALLGGYFARWGACDFKVEPEREFAVRVPFLRGVILCGKMDGLITFADGSRGVIEHKTTSEDISPLSDYWSGINRDQVALYKAASTRMGIAIDRIIYDVIRKPTIKCGKDETVEEYGGRLLNDCVGDSFGDNPRVKGYRRGKDFYFARRELPILDCDMDALARRIYIARGLIREYSRLANIFKNDGEKAIEAYPKCGSTMVCRFCPFRGLCNSDEFPEAEWESGRAHEELEIAKKFRERR